MKLKLTASAIALAFSVSATAADMIEFKAGEKAVAADVNSNFNAVNMAAEEAQATANNAVTLVGEAKAAAATNAETLATHEGLVTANASSIEMNADAIEMNADAIAANSATATANVADIAMNYDAIMAMKKVEWQMVSEAGDVVGTIVAKDGDVYTVELADGLIVQAQMGLSDIVGFNTYVDSMNRVLTMHSDGPNMAVYYSGEDCTGDAYVSVSWVDSEGATYNVADIQWQVGGERGVQRAIERSAYSSTLESGS